MEKEKKIMFCTKCGKISYVDQDDIDYPVCDSCNTFTRLEIDKVAYDLGAYDVISKFFNLGCLITEFFIWGDFGLCTLGGYKIPSYKIPFAIFIFLNNEYEFNKAIKIMGSYNGVKINSLLELFVDMDVESEDLKDYMTQYFKKLINYLNKLYMFYAPRISQANIEKASRLRRDDGLDLEYDANEKFLNKEDTTNNKYKVITLCGSTRFKDAFLETQKRLTLEGNVVISVGLFGHSGDDDVWECIPDGAVSKTILMLDDIHRQKIDMADEIFVINVGGYIGKSTKSEIEYAKKTGKAIRYLENV